MRSDPPPEIEGLSGLRARARGGFSQVYSATQNALARPVAVKVLGEQERPLEATSATPAEPDLPIPTLDSLGPEYEEKLHARHVGILLNALNDTSSNPPKNIALTGHYGSGKSSVILGVEAKLKTQKVRSVNLALSSLGLDSDRLAGSLPGSTATPPLTSLIQKAIVKQLLYRQAPSTMPGSRYYRIGSFRSRQGVGWSVVAGIGFSFIAVLFGLVGRVNSVSPSWLRDGPDWGPWAVVSGCGALFAVAWFLGLRSLQNRLRVESLSAGGGGAKISLSADESSYFDKYLDEIVYFFQQTKTTVAIFEDLDRFKDPHIFETLRELNTILNNSGQLKSKPIQFVYAVRDSIFEKLDVDSPDQESPLQGEASELESAAPANRTKFFDLVVPMVPFLTHRSARDLIASQFEGSEQKPSDGLINLVGADLTDMRLIRNIRNEFEIYRAAVLRKGGLEGLTPDRLFAMMVYKNLHLDDFEAIRLGKSNIDKAYGAFRSMVDYQMAHQAHLGAAATRQISREALWEKRCQSAGGRLKTAIEVTQRLSRRGGTVAVLHKGTSYALDSLSSVELWKSLHDSGEDIVVTIGSQQLATVPFDELVELVGIDIRSMPADVEADAAHLRSKSSFALETRKFVATATFGELLARTDLTMPPDKEEPHSNQLSLSQIVSGSMSPLAYELLANDYIDENYALYCSDYHAVAISMSAMNFILQFVQRNQASHRFRFDKPKSIDEVEKETRSRFLNGESVFNIEVFDHYLTTTPELLENAFDKLEVRSDTTFVDAYLADGDQTTAFVGHLAARWPGTFVHLIGDGESADTDKVVALVDAGIERVHETMQYDTSESVTAFFSKHYAKMQTLISSDVDPELADKAANLLARLEAEIGDLTVLGNTQRKAVLGYGLYPITRANLSTALGADGLSLDKIKSTSEVVYRRVLKDLAQYLSTLGDDEVSVVDPDELVNVLEDAIKQGDSSVQQLAERSSEDCIVANLSSLDESAWSAIVASHRFALTASNIRHFMDQIGTTSELVENLADRHFEDLEAAENEVRIKLAYDLIDVVELDDKARVRLVGELTASDYLEPSELKAAGLALIPSLVEADLVADAPETYRHISELDFAVRENYFAASTKLPAYVTDLELSSSDIEAMMKSHRVGVDVKKAIVADVAFVSARLPRSAAIAICTWAINGHEILLELLVELGKARAPAEYIIALLQPHLSDIEIEALEEVLVAMGNEYESLTRYGHHRPTITGRDGTEELLEILERRGKVSSVRAKTFSDDFKVNMLHKPK